MTLSYHFETAAGDYVEFLEKGYPQKAVHQIVGDRYSLTGTERAVLYRGLSGREECKRRISKIGEPGLIRGRTLMIDGFNVILTVASYLNGNLVFISGDGFLRDASEIHGKAFRPDLYERSIKLILEYLGTLSPAEVVFIYDEPVKTAEKLRDFTSLLSQEYSFSIKAIISCSTDKTLAENKGIIATSDSVIIDRSGSKIIDLSYGVLTFHFNTEFISLMKFCK